MKKFNKVTTTLMATSLLAGSVLAPISQIAVLAEEETNETAQKVVDLHTMLEDAKKDAILKETIYNNAKEAHKDAIKVLEGLEAKLETLKVSEKSKAEELTKATDAVTKEKLEIELNAIESEIATTEKLIVSTNEEISTITSEIEKTNKEYNNTLAKIESIGSELADLLSKITNTEVSIEESNDVINNLRSELKNTSDIKGTKDEKIASLNGTKSSIVSDIETLAVKIASETERLAKETGKRDELSSKLEAKAEELTKAQGELESIMAQSKSIREEYESKMTDALISLEKKEASEATRDDLQAQVDTFSTEEFLRAKDAKEQEIIDIQTEMSKINQEIINANTRLSSAKANVEKYKSEMEEKARVAKEAEEAVSSKNSEVAQTKNDKAAFEALHKAEFDELAEKKQVVADTEARLDEIASSLETKNATMEQLLAERSDVQYEISAYGTEEYQKQRLSEVEEEMASGAVGFFKLNAEKGNPDAVNAYNLLTNPTSFGSHLARYANDTEIGNPKDATSWDNFMYALDMAERTNELLIQESKDERTPFRKRKEATLFTVSFNAMAQAMFTSNANAKEVQRTGEWDHLRIGLTSSENIAALPTNNPDRMLDMMYNGWYTQEKENYILQDRLEKGEDVDLNDPFLQGNPSGETGHYYNMVSKDRAVTGTAVSTYNGRATYYGDMNAFATQQFINSDGGYSVSEFRDMATRYRSQLESELEKWQNAPTKVAELKAQLAEMNAEISKLDEEVLSLQQEQRTLSSDLGAKREECNVLESNLSPVYSKIAVFEENIKQLESQLEELKVQFAEKEELRIEAVEKHSKEVELVGAITEEISTKNGQLEEKVASLNVANDEYDAQYSDFYQEGVKGQLAQAEVKVSEDTVEYNNKKALADEALERYTPSKEKEAKAQEEVNSLTSQKSVLAGQLENANALVGEVTDAINNLNTNKSSKERNLDEVKEELAKTSQEIAVLEAQIKETSNNIVKEESKKTGLEETLAGLEETLESKKAETETQKGIANDLKAQLEGLKEELALNNTKLANTKATLSGLYTSKNGVANELRKYSEETVNAIKKELTAIKSEIDILTAQIDAQKNEVAKKADEEAKAKADLEKALALIEELNKKIEDEKKEEESKPTPTPSQPENNNSNEEVKPNNKPTENNSDKVETSKPANKNEVSKNDKVESNENNKVTEENKVTEDKKGETKPNDKVEVETPKVETETPSDEIEEDGFSVVGVVGAGVVVVFGGAAIAYAVRKKNEQNHK